jgi:thymidylate kinase
LLYTHSPLVVLEGLPGSGKTSLLDLLRHEFFCVPEILPSFSGATRQKDFLRHDFAKLRAGRASGIAALVDRGYASTLAWNYARLVIDGAIDYYDLLGYASKCWGRPEHRPDLYIIIDVDPATSLARKNRPVVEGDLWTRQEYLAASSLFYEHYFTVVEPQVPCLRISGKESLEAIASRILSAAYNC